MAVKPRIDNLWEWPKKHVLKKRQILQILECQPKCLSQVYSFNDKELLYCDSNPLLQNSVCKL